MTTARLQVPRADLPTRLCCVIDCSQRAYFWVGPADSNGIDDYTEVCADHIEDVKQSSDIVAPL
ncbi:MAG: hypothetical protein AB7L09_00895 [Nitrospira sp.]